MQTINVGEYYDNSKIPEGKMSEGPFLAIDFGDHFCLAARLGFVTVHCEPAIYDELQKKRLKWEGSHEELTKSVDLLNEMVKIGQIVPDGNSWKIKQKS